MTPTYTQSETAFGLRSGAGAIDPHDLADFWPRLMRGEIAPDGLVVVSDLTEDFPHWEMHPNGDELFILIEGEIDVILDRPEGEEIVRLTAGNCFIVPRTVWHRACVVQPARLIFLTFGEGTEHRAITVGD